MTTYRRDDPDHPDWITSSETVTEPGWLDDDLDGLLDRADALAYRCGGCGHYLDETLDDEHRAAWYVEELTCWACAALESNRRQRSAPGAKHITRSHAHP